jgi:transcriptional regulator with XRE-family HTH domain
MSKGVVFVSDKDLQIITGMEHTSNDVGVDKSKTSNFYFKKKRDYSTLKTLRRARGFTLEALSDLTGISPSYLSRLEAGARRLNTDLLGKLSTVLGCQPGDLLNQTIDNFYTDPGTKNVLGSKEISFDRLALSSRREQAEEGIFVQKDLPVYTMSFDTSPDSENNEYRFKIDYTTAADWVFRPYQLSGTKRGFGVYICGTQYLPKFDNGDMIFVHPLRPLLASSTIMITMKNDDVMLCQFHGWEQKMLVVSCLSRSPENRFLLSKNSLQGICKIVGSVSV